MWQITGTSTLAGPMFATGRTRASKRSMVSSSRCHAAATTAGNDGRAPISSSALRRRIGRASDQQPWWSIRVDAANLFAERRTKSRACALQFLTAPVVATILRFVDARFIMALGFSLVGCACLMAGQLTHDWVGADFLPSQLTQAVGQSFALTSLVWFSLKHLQPSEIFTFGAVLQTGRLFGAQLGTGFVQTFLRTREQTYSNLIGLHVHAGSLLTDQRLDEFGQAVASRSVGQPEAAARATALLARSVQNQAYVLAYIDGFTILGFAVIGALLLMLLLRDPPANTGQTAARR